MLLAEYQMSIRHDGPDPSVASCDRASDEVTSDPRRAAATDVACEPDSATETHNEHFCKTTGTVTRTYETTTFCTAVLVLILQNHKTNDKRKT